MQYWYGIHKLIKDKLSCSSEPENIVKIGEGTFGEAFKAGGYVCKIVPIDGDLRVNGEVQKVFIAIEYLVLWVVLASDKR